MFVRMKSLYITYVVAALGSGLQYKWMYNYLEKTLELSPIRTIVLAVIILIVVPFLLVCLLYMLLLLLLRLPLFSWLKRKSVEYLIKAIDTDAGRDIYENNLKEKRPKSYFQYSTPENKERISPIHINEIEKDKNLKLIFLAFNNRFNIFRPVGNFNLNSLQRQRTKEPADKQYFQKYNSFHSDYISPFCIESVKAYGKTIDFGCKYNTGDGFLELLDNKEHKIIYISGEVGCGKSTFISRLVYFAKKVIDSKQTNIVVICANLGKEEVKSFYEEDEKINTIIYKIFEKAFRESFRKIKIQDSQDLVNEIKKNFHDNHVLNIVIDNLDEVYDHSSKLILKTTKNSSEFDSFYGKNKYYTTVVIKLFDVINDVIADVQNIKFILGLRPETYKVINEKRKELEGANRLERRVEDLNIELKNCNVEDMIEKRFQLGGISDNSKNIMKFAKEFGKQSAGLKINGNRHIMHSLNNLCNTSVENLFYPGWMIKIYIYLDGNKKYCQNPEHSQQICGILNIFLINIDYRNDVDDYHKEWPEYTKKPHYQTFWLKYLICAYLHHIKEDIEAKHLIKKFDGYEEEIIRFCLYSLTEVRHGRLVSCESDGNHSYNLNQTPRLNFCLDDANGVFFTFPYLAVIVTDNYLERPTLSDEKYKQEIEQLFKKQYEYKITFFTKDNKKWKEWLLLSIKKVFVFIRVLESSMKYYEKPKIDNKEIEKFFPDFQKITEKLEKEIKEIAGTIDISEPEIEKEIQQAKDYNKKIEKTLNKHFQNYYKFYQKYKRGFKKEKDA